MKKLGLAVAFILLASLFAAPAFAEVSIGGSYRAYAVYQQPKGDVEENQWWEQRMRVGFKWAVNDNVAVQLRGDFAEFNWGDGYRPEEGKDTLMVDRAFVTLKKGFATVSVGQQTTGIGNGIIYSDQFTGISSKLDFSPVTVQMLYHKRSEGGVDGNNIKDDGIFDDTDIYGVSVNYAAAAFSVGLHFVDEENEPIDSSKQAYALSFYAPIGDMMTLSGEIDYFDGDVGNVDSTDYTGTQAFVALGVAFSEKLKGKLTLIYADDADDDEIQLTNIRDDYWFDLADFRGKLQYSDGYIGHFNASGTSVFDPAFAGDGVLGAVAEASFAVNESLSIFGVLGYSEPDNDDSYLDSYMFGTIAADYTLLPSATLSAGAGYGSPDYNTSQDDDAAVTYMVQLTVTF